MSDVPVADHLELSERLTAGVLAPMKRTFVGKDEIVDLLGDWKRWRQFAMTAPQVRLDRWAFAVSGSPSASRRAAPAAEVVQSIATSFDVGWHGHRRPFPPAPP